MTERLTHLHVFHLVAELRRSALDGQQRVADYDDDGLALCIAAGLMNDAADALEALLAERPANDDDLGGCERELARRGELPERN